MLSVSQLISLTQKTLNKIDVQPVNCHLEFNENVKKKTRRWHMSFATKSSSSSPDGPFNGSLSVCSRCVCC